MNNALEQLVNDVDGALAAAVVDLDSGLIVGAYHNIPYFTQSYVDAVGAAAVDMFRGKTITAVETMMAAQRGDELKYHIKEIQMTSDGTFHFMAIVADKPDYLLVFITRTTTNLGSGWLATRDALKAIAPLCP
jgi:predicted regulator of Ras-like GTPase activity (Roadblock/LC7/MglB family)